MSLSPLGQYRRNLYDCYVSVLNPAWQQPAARAGRIWAAATLRRLQGWLPSHTDVRCLDLGCGTGTLIKTLGDRGFLHVRGVDISPEAVAIAQTDGLDVVEADLKDYLAHCHEQYDLILLFDVIEHFAKEEMPDLLRLVWRQLTAAGTCIIQTPNAASPWAGQLMYGDLTHEWVFTPQCLSSALRLAGFRYIEVRPVDPTIHGVKSLLRWLVWRAIWCGCAVWNMAESGGLNGGIYTRNMLVRARKDDFQW